MGFLQALGVLWSLRFYHKNTQALAKTPYGGVMCKK